MPTEHTERSPKSDVPSTSELLPSVDPLRLLWVVTAGALAVILAYLHFYPQAANPMHGITPALGIVMLVGASVLIVARLADVGVRPFIPMLLPCALVLWAAWRTSRAAVPSEGVALLGTMLEATLVFAISLVLTVAAREWKSFSFQLASGTSKGLRLLTSADLTRGKTDKPRPGSRDLSEAEPPRLFLDTVISFFLILAVIMCLWAIWQYFVSYDRQLVEFERDIKARGFALADLPSREWALLQALRGKRVGSLFGNPNVLAGFLAMVAPMALAGAAIWNDRSAKAAALAVLTSCWYVAVLSGSRGGLLTIALATALAAVVMGREAWRKQRRVLLIASALCAIAVVLALATERTSAARPVPTDSAPLPTARYTFFERLHGARTVRQRIYYLQSGWAMIRKSPLLGQGLGSYAALYPQHKRPMARETRYP
ncbi:O-antigen ligase family protein, partial [Candidatus Sumerlaeota bacterium]|nr:O-antigen ligase family protein [Candidatus Sumerlaeota bacterium]